jgi:hypothetical protein
VQGYSRVLKALTRLGVLRIQRMQRDSVLASTPRVPHRVPLRIPPYDPSSKYLLRVLHIERVPCHERLDLPAQGRTLVGGRRRRLRLRKWDRA